MKTATAYTGWKKGMLEVLAGGVLLALLLLSGPAGYVYSEEVDTPSDPPAEAQTADESGDGDAEVVTGNAGSQTDIENHVNTNDVSVGEDADTDDGGGELDEGEDLSDEAIDEGEDAGAALYEEEEHASSSEPLNVAVKNSNDADVANAATTTAETGDNGARAERGNASVDSGDAGASANVINVVNTDLYNSQGFIMLLNLLFGVDTLDLRDNFSFFTEEGTSTSDCSLESCSAPETNLSIVNNNDAGIINDILVRSGSGTNTASTSEGDASVDTGNAFAGANVVNVANSNFVDSNYLLLSINSFAGLGDLILPNASFFQQFFGGGGFGGNASISNTNTADVGNDVEVGAESGGNEASGGDGSSVDTGNAIAASNVFNHVNGNWIGGDNFFLLIRVHGNWAGEVFNAPPGIAWTDGPGGIQLYSDPDAGSGSTTEGSSLSIDNDNTASIKNNVKVFALTGDNKAESAKGAASIATGNAYAAANVVNVANTNVIGRNWVFAILNIFGDWSGNISFGRPDLWIGATATGGGHVDVDAPIDYTFTVSNRGDADAHNVMLKPSNMPHLAFEQPGPWNIGTVPAGETREVRRQARVRNTLPFGQSVIALSVSGNSDEGDDNLEDNIEEIPVTVTRANNAAGARRPDVETTDPIWHITKEASATTTIPAGSSVTYTVVVQNDGGPAYDAVLYDTLRNTEGEVIKKHGWNLAAVAAGEEIRVTYTIAFGEALPSGEYTNEAHVEARSRSIAPQFQVDANSDSAYSTIVLGPPVPQPVETHSLELSNVRVTAIGGTRDTALIEWDTNVPATSEVVYGIESEDEYEFDVEDGDHYGYPEGTVRDESKKLHHRILLTGLTPGEAYKYRAVSFASPGVGSDEYAFVLSVLSKPEPAAEGPIAKADVPLKEKLVAEYYEHEETLKNEPIKEDVPEMAMMVPTSSRMNLASVALMAGENTMVAVWALLAAVFFLSLIVNRRRELQWEPEEEGAEKK